MSDDLNPVIVQYLMTRYAERQNAAVEAFTALTERERRLVREAAVMGWVQGRRHHDLPVPKDSQITQMVVNGCLSHPELYPTIAAHTDDAEE